MNKCCVLNVSFFVHITKDNIITPKKNLQNATSASDKPSSFNIFIILSFNALKNKLIQNNNSANTFLLKEKMFLNTTIFTCTLLIIISKYSFKNLYYFYFYHDI